MIAIFWQSSVIELSYDSHQFQSFMKTDSKKSALASFAWSLLIIYLFYLATVSWVKLLWNHQESTVFLARVKFIMGITFFGSIAYIIGTYHIVGHSQVDPFFTLFICSSLIYLGVGLMVYPFLQKK